LKLVSNMVEEEVPTTEVPQGTLLVTGHGAFEQHTVTWKKEFYINMRDGRVKYDSRCDAAINAGFLAGAKILRIGDEDFSLEALDQLKQKDSIPIVLAYEITYDGKISEEPREDVKLGANLLTLATKYNRPRVFQTLNQTLLAESNFDSLSIHIIVNYLVPEGWWLNPFVGNLRSVNFENPSNIFMRGADSYSTSYQHQGSISWKFVAPVQIQIIRIQAEEYSDYGHFAKDITFSAKHDGVYSRVKITTERRGGWQYFNVGKMKGQEWSLFAAIGHDPKRYLEIAELDFFGTFL